MRFHCGISFSWRTIKKFLIPFLIGVLGCLGFSYIGEHHKEFNILELFSPLKVSASANYNTNFNFSIPNYDNILNEKSCGTTNMKEFTHDFIELFEQHYSNDYTLHINLTNNNVVVGGTSVVNGDYELIFKVYPKSYNNRNRVNFSIESQTSQGNTWYSNILKRFFSSTTHTDYVYTINIDTCNANPLTSSTYNALLNLLGGGVFNQDVNTYSSFFSSVEQDTLQYDYYTNLNISDNTDFDLPNLFNSWIYYSSVPINFNQSGCTGYCKALHINNTDTTYQLSDTIPTYWDIRNTYPNPEPVPDNDFIDYKSKLGTLYMNFTPSQLSNLSYSMTFNTYNLTALQYRQNLYYNWSCFGRVNHNDTYYTYEEFPYCDFEDTGNYISDSNLLNIKFQNFKFYDINNNVISNFSNYDKLFIYVDFNYTNDNLDKTISNIYFNTSANYYLSDNYKGTIYDNFYNLPLYFKLFISANKNSYFSVRNNINPITDKYFLYKQFYNTSNLNSVGEVSYLGTNFQQIYLNYDTSQALMIYQQLSNQNSGLDNNNLDFIITKDIIISKSSVNSNNFYYYDNTGTLSNSNIDIDYSINPDNSYDLNYYFNSIEKFLYDINYKISSFHDITQDFYDNIPTTLQTTIFVLFLLLLTYVIFKELRR